MSQPLYNYLSEQGHYTKSYEDFQKQFANESSQKSLYDFMFKSGDYTKSIGDFYNQFFAKKVKVEKEKVEKQVVNQEQLEVDIGDLRVKLKPNLIQKSGTN